MADTIDGLVAEIRTVVDVTAVEALSALNRRHRTMVSRARSYRKVVELGPTVAGTGFYAAPAGLVEFLPGGLRVGGIPYSKARRDDVYAQAQGTLSWTGPGGLVVVDADDTGVQGLSFVPEPTEDDLSIEAFVALLPADVVSGNPATALRVDADMYDALVDAASATFLWRQGEGDYATAEQRFDAACEELRRRVNHRFRGPGPAQIRLQGINA